MKAKIKVLHLCKTYYPDTFGGVEQVVRTLCQYSDLHHIEAAICTVSPSAQSISLAVEEGCQVWRFPETLSLASSPFSASLFMQFHALAKKYDVIHCHFPWPFADLLVLLRPMGCRLLITYHSDVVRQKYLGRIYSPLQQRFLSQARAVVATSDNYVASSPVLQRFVKKVQTIPLGMDFPGWALGPRREVVHLPSATPYFVFIGGFRYYKGLKYLLEAMSQVNAHLVLIGDGADRNSYEILADHYAPGRVHFLGAVDDRAKFAVLADAYAFVFPSHVRSEAYGLGLVEAAMMGKAMISCEMGTGTSFVNVNGLTGLTVPPANVDALAKAMRQMLAQPELVEQMGENALHRYTTELTAAKMAGAYADLYTRLLQTE
ncbi:glycosyltransferase [Chitinibacter bivalviorum]|uniref:Glycosyltransferase n=1 Tax=Chitinibacter bivalviorum TaxID=2739434 RepID=A0A7H9BM21_9NEIS|nr:glycosyltransferase [Chitinibacter bivalviorum]QLG89663.1 glycosyltransferase [Chitinibacter bivalviorum]